MNLIEEVARHLEFAGIGYMATAEEDGDIFFGHMPDEPDEAVCVFSSDSARPGDEDGARIQVMTRGVVGDARTPYERALKVTEALDGFTGFLAGDGPMADVEVVMSARGVGRDTSGRELYASTYAVTYCDM